MHQNTDDFHGTYESIIIFSHYYCCFKEGQTLGDRAHPSSSGRRCTAQQSTLTGELSTISHH